MVPPPVGTPVDIAFGTAVLAIGAAALVIMGNGFGVGVGPQKRGRDGMGLPGAPDARPARDDEGNRPDWPPGDDNKQDD